MVFNKGTWCPIGSYSFSVFGLNTFYFKSHEQGLGRAHIRVEMSTEFTTRVPDTRYPTGTRVLVTVNLVSD